MVATRLGSPAPLFSLVLGGEVALSEGGRSALWDVLVLFLRQGLLHGGSAVGSRSLEDLGVASAARGRRRPRASPLRLKALMPWS